MTGLTYREVGATAGELPLGYRTFDRTVELPAPVDFETAAAELFRWQVQRRAGLHVRASSPVVEPGAEVVLGFPLLPVRAPCRVVRVVDEPDRRGFAYGTLPGHPESGEESFVLDRLEGGRVLFTIRAFSRPASVLAKAAGPLGRRIQDFVTRRYLVAFGQSS
jgi:uncharacterized protein (UPF0548 family)